MCYFFSRAVKSAFTVCLSYASARILWRISANSSAVINRPFKAFSSSLKREQRVGRADCEMAWGGATLRNAALTDGRNGLRPSRPIAGIASTACRSAASFGW